MEALELVEKLSQSDIIASELPLGLQLGLPWLEERNGRLCIRFLPHREEYVENCICYYAPQFEIAWVWPFAHLASFRNLTLEGTVNVSQPLCTISVDRLLSVGKFGMDELYDECSKILTIRDETGTITSAWIRAYQKKYLNLIETLDLTELYTRKTDKENEQ